MSLKEKLDKSRLPRHVAIIMDGNGRWARKRGKERTFGHQEGVVSVRKIVEAAASLGIQYLTMYTFSTENWHRPQEEVYALMALLVSAIHKETPLLMDNNICLKAIGDLSKLPDEARSTLMYCIEQTSKNSGTTLILALSYSARWEIVEAAKTLALKVKSGEIEPQDIKENLFSDSLSTKGIPDPDMIIRTGGERRISNFLLWQISYAEFYFTDDYWPDFREEEFYEALLYYQNRERRFGMTSQQIIDKQEEL